MKKPAKVMRPARGILASPAWKKYLAEPDYIKAATHHDAVRRLLTRRGIETLMALFPDAGERERLKATIILSGMSVTDDPRMTADQRRRLIDTLVRALDDDEYLRTNASWSAVHSLQGLAPERLEAILVLRPAPKDLGRFQREFLVSALTRFTSPAAVKRLKEQMKQGGPAGDLARRHLEARGLLGTAFVRKLAERWRETRSPDALHSLYGRYIANQVGKVTVKRLVALLGRPSRRSGRCVWYMPNRDTALFMEADEKGLLTATKFT
jgi:hypothetical protein